MSGVFQNIDPPPPHRPASVYGGRTHSLGGERWGGSIVRKTSDTALYSIYVSTLCIKVFKMQEQPPALQTENRNSSKHKFSLFFLLFWEVHFGPFPAS
jgi:hypothetical protein